MKLFNKTLIAAAASLVCASAAQAGSVASQFFGGFQQLSDNSAEYQNADLNGNGLLDLGDQLRGIFTIETIEKTGFPTHQLGQASGNNELTGLFEAVVAAVFSTPDNPLTLFVDETSYTYIFAPTASFGATYGPGAMIAMFEDSTPDYTRVLNATCVDIATCEATATNGSPFMTLGFSAANNFWQATSTTNNIASIGAIPAPGNGGVFNAGLNILSNSSGLAFNQVDCGIVGNMVDVCGSGSLLGTGGVGTPFQSFDNVDFTVNAKVPEPATLGLLGLGLLGMGAMVRRRKA